MTPAALLARSLTEHFLEQGFVVLRVAKRKAKWLLTAAGFLSCFLRAANVDTELDLLIEPINPTPFKRKRTTLAIRTPVKSKAKGSQVARTLAMAKAKGSKGARTTAHDDAPIVRAHPLMTSEIPDRADVGGSVSGGSHGSRWLVWLFFRT